MLNRVRRGSFLANLMVPVLLLAVQVCLGRDDEKSRFSRDDFPQDFIFGAGTSAYQWEGAATEDGRSPSVWDTFTHAGRMRDKSTGDVACDGYHKYKEDVKLIADTGMDSFRLSISWSRLIPRGRGAVNPKGLIFYNNVIDELVKYGIKPHVTLHHLDLPQVLQDEYGGWLSKNIVDDFVAYADVCFREFGDRVKQWTTMVEPNVAAISGYDIGVFPPNRCSSPFGFNCTVGDSTTEPYIVVHNMMLAHGSAATLYKKKYQAKQNGWVGLNVYSMWCYPFSNSSSDMKASQRTIDFMMGWVLHPLIFGDYPQIMKKIARKRLPSFSKDQAEQLKASFDFIGLNHYVSVYVKDNSNVSKTQPRDFSADMFALLTVSKNETPTGQFVPTHVPSDPVGLQHMLKYLQGAYGNPPIFIEENGYGLGVKDTLNDTERIDFLSGFMSSTLDAMRDGANVKGYYVWSLMDVFEFLAGYNSRFGLYYVDFRDGNRTRRPKLSANWYSKFLQRKMEVKLRSIDSSHENSQFSATTVV